MADGTGDFLHERLIIVPVASGIQEPFDHRHQTVEADPGMVGFSAEIAGDLVQLVSGAVQQLVVSLGCHPVDRGIQIKSVLFPRGNKERTVPAFFFNGLETVDVDCTLAERQVFIGDHFIHGNRLHIADPGAMRAGTGRDC